MDEKQKREIAIASANRIVKYEINLAEIKELVKEKLEKGIDCYEMDSLTHPLRNWDLLQNEIYGKVSPDGFQEIILTNETSLLLDSIKHYGKLKIPFETVGNYPIVEIISDAVFANLCNRVILDYTLTYENVKCGRYENGKKYIIIEAYNYSLRISKKRLIQKIIDYTIITSYFIMKPIIDELIETLKKTNTDFYGATGTRNEKETERINTKRSYKTRKKKYNKVEFIKVLSTIRRNKKGESIKPNIEKHLGLTYRRYRQLLEEFNINSDELKKINPNLCP